MCGVDGLEIVEIAEQQCPCLPGALGGGDRCIDAFEQ
jgi:hypothetical protein